MRSSKTLRIPGLVLATAALTFTLAVCAQAQTVTFLHAFRNGVTATSLVQATDGNFYGAVNAYGVGQIFRMTPTGKVTTIHNFCSLSDCVSSGSLTLGSDGYLYGVTGSRDSGSAAGTFYKMTVDGRVTALYTFCSDPGCPDAVTVYSVTEASDGNFYGVSAFGGASGQGTIFRISPTGEFKLLYTFCSLANCADGAQAFTPLIQGSDGNLYGATEFGGANQSGVIYRLTLDGSYTVLHNFCSSSGSGCADGTFPTYLAQDADGNLFGTTYENGRYGGGTIFELTATGRFSVLHNFDFVDGDGSDSGLVLANDGNFYGSTELGGVHAIGTLFEITPAGAFSSLYSFGNLSWVPAGRLLQGTDGKIYGFTTGNLASASTIFSLDHGLSPLVETVPAAGTVGKRVLILGNNLTGTSSVTFNGVPAEFTVEKDSFIRATVPAGATTGIVSVVTPSGTLNSNPQFVVTQ